MQGFITAVYRMQYDNGQVHGFKVLLKNQITVEGNKNIELPIRQQQQLGIVFPAPASERLLRKNTRDPAKAGEANIHREEFSSYAEARSRSFVISKKANTCSRATEGKS